MVGLELSLLVHRARVRDLLQEVRQASAAVQALATEALEAPAELPRDRGMGSTFTASSLVGGHAPSLAELFTPQEERVAALMVEGRSNRAIADALVISPETVKTHVARVVRKLGASNRIEAAALYMKIVRDQ
ncbi:MAG: helix-turn-helix transcriptional regulator [Actinobacteria bacterium]|nr:helix-turn-helix transcriptional regulator [Actinomycetota bacterium]